MTPITNHIILTQSNPTILNPKTPPPPPPPSVAPKNWHDRAIAWLDSAEHSLDKVIPPHFFQKKIDQIGSYIERTFAPLRQFNEWLQHNGEGAWYKKMATFLCKLPMRVVRNFVSLLYQIIYATFHTATHPIKSLVKLAKLIVSLVHQLTIPATWSRIGAGIVGASLGQSLIGGGPLSLIGIGIGGAMIASGLTFGALKAAVQAEKGHRWHEIQNALSYQLERLPEAMLTGFCMGLLLGAVQSEINARAQKIYKDAINDGVNEQLSDFGLPPSSDITLDASRGLIVKWPIESMPTSTRWLLQLFQKTTVTKTEIALHIPADVANIPPLTLPSWLQQGLECAPVTAAIPTLGVIDP